MKRLHRIVIVLLLSGFVFFGMLLMQRCQSGFKPADRVILIGIDGMGISGFQQARTPHLDALVSEGALSFRTRAVMPTVSAPNWGSHLLGAGPEQHGITANGWTVDNHTVEPAEQDEAGFFPSVFSLVRQQMPGALTGFFYDWEALADLYNIETIDEVAFSTTFDSTFYKATSWILGNKPDFTFIYVGHPDSEGHAHQWGSKEYLQALEDVDAALGTFFNSLKQAGLYEGTHFIVVTDHGGVGYGHGGLSMEEIEIPWIVSGPGIIRDRMIEQPGDVFNTASTIAYLFGLEQPLSWTGRPYYGAFMHHPLSDDNRQSYVPQPVASIESGLYPQSEAVAMEVSTEGVVIRYALDGKIPDANAPVYKSPILLQRTVTMKAAAFREDQRSRITELAFTKVVAGGTIRLANQPDDKYPGQGSYTLLNRQKGTQQYTDGQWIGFRVVDLEAFITFPERTDVSRVSLGIYHKPASWIFPPEHIRVLASVDGQDYREIGRLEREQIYRGLRQGRNELAVVITPALTKYIKLVAKNTAQCPAGHSAEGEPAWLFVDEIILE